jgi:hypothetical protein
MDAHFAISLQILYLPSIRARRMLASCQKWQEGVGVALTANGHLARDIDDLMPWAYAQCSDQSTIGS